MCFLTAAPPVGFLGCNLSPLFQFFSLRVGGWVAVWPCGARPPLPLLSYIYRTIWYSSVPLQGVRCLILLFFTPTNLNKNSVHNFCRFFWGVTVVGHLPHETTVYCFSIIILLTERKRGSENGAFFQRHRFFIDCVA